TGMRHFPSVFRLHWDLRPARRCGLRSQPLLKESGGLGPLDAAANGARYAAPSSIDGINSQPKWKMQVNRLARALELVVAQLEEALLKDASLDLVGQQCLRVLLGE